MVVAARLENGSLSQREGFVLDEPDTNSAPAGHRPKPAKWTQVAANRLNSGDIDCISAFRAKNRTTQAAPR
jgi:hypothetical protein